MDGTLVMEKGTIRDLLLLFALNRENLRAQPLQRSLRRAYKSLRAFQQPYYAYLLAVVSA